jgi:hypothetical protein
VKNPPTLADAFVAFSMRPKLNPSLAKACRAMLPARKFVIDDAMSRYWADAEMAIIGKGSYRRRMMMLNNMRLLSRLPHALTWIEHDPRPYRARTMERHGLQLKPGMKTAMRQGWLIQQHPNIETAFHCAKYAMHDDEDDLKLNIFNMAWCADDTTVVPWRRSNIPDEWMTAAQDEANSNLAKKPIKSENPAPDDYVWHDSELLGGMTGYRNDQIRIVDGLSADLRPFFRPDHTPRSIWSMRAQGRAVWMMLSMINDLPVNVEHVEPSRGFVARGSYKKFLKHSIVHLTVPETQWRALIAKTDALLRRRAHQVRGHWRMDWRNPLHPLCEHVFAEDLTCTRCRGRKLWIGEHQRGDSSLGFVTHDYEVHHDK